MHLANDLDTINGGSSMVCKLFEEVKSVMKGTNTWNLVWKESNDNKFEARGSHGKVRRVEFSHSLNRKDKLTMFMEKSSRPEKELELENEWTILKGLKDSSIVTYLGCLNSPKLSFGFCLFLEECQEDMSNIIQCKRYIYSIYSVIQWMKQLFAALYYLEKQNIIHADIKPDNILLKCREEKDGKIWYDAKLCDFGLSKRQDSSINYVERVFKSNMNLRYMSPDAIENQLRFASDVYGLGMIFWELIERRYIDGTDITAENFKNRKNIKLSPPNTTDRDLRGIVDNCLELNYEDRDKPEKIVRKLNDKIEKFTDDQRDLLPIEKVSGVHDSELKLYRPIGFDGTRDKKEWSRQADKQQSKKEEFLKKLEDPGVKSCALARKTLQKQLSTAWKSKLFYRVEKYENDFERLRRDFDSPNCFDENNIRRDFCQVLDEDFSYQEELFEYLIELLFVGRKIKETHIDLGCWDLLELLEEGKKALNNLKIKQFTKNYSIGSYKKASEETSLLLLKRSEISGLFLEADEDGYLLQLWNVKWEEWEGESFIYDERLYTKSDQAETLTINVLRAILNERIVELKEVAIEYTETFLNSHSSALDYLFNLKSPPLHASSCPKPENCEKIRSGQWKYPKEVDIDARMPFYECTNSHDNFKIFVQVYTKLCKAIFLLQRNIQKSKRFCPATIIFKEIKKQNKTFSFATTDQEEKKLLIELPIVNDNDSEILTIDQDHQITRQRIQAPQENLKVETYEFFKLERSNLTYNFFKSKRSLEN